MTESTPFVALMQEGARQHRARQPEQALLAFEKALTLEPGNINASNACATLLTELGQPRAAYEVLLQVREALLADADGAANLAIAAENCGLQDAARSAYQRALELDPNHLRSLNNTALLLARDGDFDAAITSMQRCADMLPNDPLASANLADMLMAGRKFARACSLLKMAVSRFADNDALRFRLILAWAFDGQIDAAQEAIAALSQQRRDALQALLARANRASNETGRLAPRAPDAYDLFCDQAFEAMQQCDWRDHDRVAAVVRDMLARATRTGQLSDWRNAQFYGLMLPLDETELYQVRRITIAAIGQDRDASVAPYVASRSPHRDGRIHVGLAAQNLHDARYANALERQLQLHDRSVFALHVYSPSPQPERVFSARLAALGVPVVELAHMTDAEAAGRIRLDGLDVFVDTAFYTPWCRPELVELRVAPVQLRQTTWHRYHPAGTCEYSMSDMVVHPPSSNMHQYGAIVRLPATCWLAANDDQPHPTPQTRSMLGLPEQALVLCAFLPAIMVDPATFATWMQMLKALPQAVLWLPAFPKAARNNLAQAAQAAGVEPRRVHYLPYGDRAQTLGRMGLADLFVDSLRYNANHGLADALRMGVPAISCAGNSMAARLGASIITAAGLAHCVVDTPAALVDLVRQLGNDPAALAALRQTLRDRLASCALFDMPARIGEWEFAWASMVQRHRAGLPPAAFDVPIGATSRLALAPVSP